MSLNMPSPQAGFAPAPVNSTEWNSQVVEAAAQAQQQAISYKATDPKSSFDWIPDWIKTPVEWAGSKLHTAYTYAISRPLATAFMAPEIAIGTGNTNPFSSDTWDRAWNDSAHTSPGQALAFGVTHFFDDKDELRRALQAPVNYTPKDIFGKPAKDASGKPITQNLNQNGLLWDNPNAVKQQFDHGASMWISGGLDAAISWYADPFALGGKALGDLRKIAYVRPAQETANKTLLGAVADKITNGAIGVPTTVNNIDKNLNSSAFNSMSDLIMKQKTKLGPVQGPSLPGETLPTGTFEDWASRQMWAKNSADAGALSAQLGKAANKDEVNQVLAISLGDEQAINQLSRNNAELGAMTTMLQRQKQGLITNFPANPNPGQSAIHAQQLEDISDQLSKIDAQSSSISDKLALANSMKSGMYFNPYISPIASNLGQKARDLQAMKWEDAPFAGASLLYNNFYVRPLRLFTGNTWGDIKAPGHIDLNDANSHRALDASLNEAKVFTPQERQQMVSNYIGLDTSQRGTYLDVIDRATIGRIAQKYDMTDDQVNALYSQIGGMRGQAKDGRIYSTARIDTASGGSIRADHVDDAGNVISISPLLNSQLENTHVMTDYQHFNEMLKYNSGAFKKLFNEQEIQARAAVNGPLTQDDMQLAAQAAIQGTANTVRGRIYGGVQAGKDIGELMNKMWKFNTLFRLGYGPRAITDDVMGQAARLGAWSVFGERLLGGGRNMIMRNWNKTLNDVTGFQQQASALESGISILTDRAAKYQQKIEQINSFLPPAMSYEGKGAKGIKQMNQRTSLLQDVQQRLDDTHQTLEALKAQRNKLGQAKDTLGDQYVIMPDGTAFPRPFEGPQGALFRDLNAGRRTIDNVLGGSASSIWNAYRSNDWRTLTSADKGHLQAWLKDVQYQIANDPAAMQAVAGKTPKELESWFGSQEGRAYRSDSAMNNISDADHADRIVAHVNQYLPTHTPEAMAVRQAVIDKADDTTVGKLMSQVALKDRPDVQSAGLQYAMGKGDVAQSINNLMNKYYHVVTEMPSEMLSRNPLFFQLYRQHVSELWSGAMDQGITHLSPARQQMMAESARKLALKDVKRFTFNMDFESKLAFNMRFIAPFWGPMQEAFTRWGRLAADKPDIIAHAATIYNAPITAGHAVDNNGNSVDTDGYVTNPDGTRTLVSKADMHFQFQIPTWAQKGLGVDGGTMIDMPVSRLNFVLQNDPWFNPGMGPWVQVPANYAALKSDPKVGDMLQKLGVLQSVQQNSLSQVAGSGPKFLNQLITGDPEQQQRDMIQIMQREDYKYKNGLRDTQPTWQEVKDQAAHGALLRSFMKTALPVSANFKDPYQFFRDQYTQLQQANPKTADQVFLAKYGEAAFAFTGALTKSGKGLPSTAEAVMADKKYSYLTDKFPELAPLIVGPYGQGQFSQTAYAQQLASGERTKLTAKQSMDQAQANLGWATFSKYMNQLSAQLYQNGFTSFQDKGAEGINNQRKAVISMLSSPTLPNGKPNPYYNDQFSQQYNTVDRTKDDRMADVMRQIVTEGSLINDPKRSDIRSLSQYLINRTAMKTVLNNRQNAGGSNDINAKTNVDLKNIFHGIVMNMVEQDTQFQSLHDRFLVHDMFNHYDPSLSQQTGG